MRFINDVVNSREKYGNMCFIFNVLLITFLWYIYSIYGVSDGAVITLNILVLNIFIRSN